MRCTQPGCMGRIMDGYCDVCGMPASAAPSAKQASLADRAHPTPRGTGVPGQVPNLKPTGPCKMPGCSGQIVDGYCNTCGSPDGAVPPAQTSAISTASRIGTISLGSSRTTANGPKARPTDARREVYHLGAGLTKIPPEPLIRAESAILKNPEVAEDRRYCPHCNAEVGRATKDSPGRVEGFCPSCRKPYSFTPKLTPGELVAGQYEVGGCLAHGGQGWIYLAKDRNVSDRWVVLKGLLNVGDEASMEAAMAEQRYLAEIQHPQIVEIYNFVLHGGGAYIVMEYVAGRSLKQILKSRMGKNSGTFDPLPVDQGLAYILEILPAFSYLHSRGLLYCDFKPDNLMHVEDSVKLIDMGGVRRIDDDESTIFGTIGFQAPEVPTQGCSVASEIYTIGRTLMVLCSEVKGYQSTYATTLPPITEVPVFSRYDSVYRLIAKACAPNPLDRFESAEEMRYQVRGVLREVVSTARGTAATSSSPSDFFEPPTVVADVFTWKQLPDLEADEDDAGTVVVAALDPTMDPRARFQTLLASPVKTKAVSLALCLAAIEIGANDVLTKTVNDILTKDPWEWRAAWIEGLSALNLGDWKKAQSCFNAVYGQVPGELAPKFALAVACEMGGELDIAEQLYQICVATDGAYVPGAAFGLARVRAKRKDPKGLITDTTSILKALDLVPATSGGYPQSRRLAASYLTYSGTGLPDLSRAFEALKSSGASAKERLQLELDIFTRALPLTQVQNLKGTRRSAVPSIGDVPATKADIRAKIESILRQQASLEKEPAVKIALIDQANSLRKWTLT
ncbi:MAG: serine/threonine-protein kinase PknG [Propionibacteriaceae bacterium]|nr:serine/threonine-protein kinase PknG [Propionibacteriaceae bacterium]